MASTFSTFFQTRNFQLNLFETFRVAASPGFEPFRVAASFGFEPFRVCRATRS
jgi:hypothetical protein